MPILEYGCIIWDPHFSKDKILLENVQLLTIRIATRFKNSSPPLQLASLESR